MKPKSRVEESSPGVVLLEGGVSLRRLDLDRLWRYTKGRKAEASAWRCGRRWRKCVDVSGGGGVENLLGEVLENLLEEVFYEVSSSPGLSGTVQGSPGRRVQGKSSGQRTCFF